MAEGGISKEGGPDSHIIAGVIEGVRQSFIDSGVDMEVLAKLEELWVSKLGSSNGVAIADVIMPEAVSSRKGREKKYKKKATTAKVKTKTDIDGGSNLDELIIVNDSESDDSEKEMIVRGTSDQAPVVASSVSKVKKKTHKKPKMIQVDGPADSSDEEDAVDDDDDGDDDDDDDDDDIDPDGDEDDEGVEEEPLGSEDDISDEDASDLFETDNVVVCQYDKITRARNKWKFHLKDGIMNLNGKDYVFQRAHGDAEW